MTSPFQHGCIIGLGLLGGSLAWDLRQHYPEMAITGIARREETLTEAAEQSVGNKPIYTRLTTSLAAVRDADLIVLCTPVQTIITQLAEMAPLLSANTVVTDVGSTKRMIMNAAATVLPSTVYFIGGHPMAGSERKGLSHARGGLYQGATWALCIPEAHIAAAERMRLLIDELGGLPLEIDADTHDALVALTSHLPHVVAGALANVVLGSANGAAVTPFIAGGFRDTTRVAAASPAMWRDICLTNRDQLTRALSLLIGELETWRDAIRSGDTAHLDALLTTASLRREALNRDK